MTKPVAVNDAKQPQRKDLWWQRSWARFAGVAAALGLLMGFFNDLGHLRTFFLSFMPPQVEVEWLDASRPQIGDAIELDPSNVDPTTRRVRLPLMLAVKNREWWPMTATTVEVSVGDSILLRSPARMKLQAGQAVREHDGMRLEPSPSYTTVAGTDTLLLPIEIGTLGWLVLTNNKLPVVFPWRVAARQKRLLDTATIVVQAAVYFEGRPRREVGVRFKVPPLIEPTWPAGRGLLEPSAADRRLFMALANGSGVTAARWQEMYPPTGDSVLYRRCWRNGGGYQSLSVNRIQRYVAADTNRDALLDFELLDLDGDGRADKRALTRGAVRRVIFWGPEVVRINAQENQAALRYMAHRIAILEH